MIKTQNIWIIEADGAFISIIRTTAALWAHEDLPREEEVVEQSNTRIPAKVPRLVSWKPNRLPH